ncbi:uncharacterized protein BDR25DRAFT_396984 [Lindgomyces ingoldianus]|uniref:Uncharacterized protein n=1 Tax=Lindgomyces ingoldianus TaxID=673940 RepID=A0ACB6QA68_9PLEO|nr:uncharacterized protein BDR25DRAFT_396984 [Lindgomyces ingoldianus]KAF2463858.1 hypothetical protein BDR25DRAFT_396984 [Lindgomyces ingoldianus]
MTYPQLRGAYAHVSRRGINNDAYSNNVAPEEAASRFSLKTGLKLTEVGVEHRPYPAVEKPEILYREVDESLCSGKHLRFSLARVGADHVRAVEADRMHCMKAIHICPVIELSTSHLTFKKAHAHGPICDLVVMPVTVTDADYGALSLEDCSSPSLNGTREPLFDQGKRHHGSAIGEVLTDPIGSKIAFLLAAFDVDVGWDPEVRFLTCNVRHFSSPRLTFTENFPFYIDHLARMKILALLSRNAASPSSLLEVLLSHIQSYVFEKFGVILHECSSGAVLECCMRPLVSNFELLSRNVASPSSLLEVLLSHI